VWRVVACEWHEYFKWDKVLRASWHLANESTSYRSSYFLH
jgi:hypothetical protein